MREPARHYEYISSLHCYVAEALLAPFRSDGEAVGTVWAITHRPDRRFTEQHARSLNALAELASNASDLLERLSFGNEAIRTVTRVHKG